MTSARDYRRLSRHPWVTWPRLHIRKDRGLTERRSAIVTGASRGIGRDVAVRLAADGYDTAIILNSHGKVSEAPGACVMFMRDGKLITPDLTSGILESITRDALLTLARDVVGISVEERVVDRTELYLADEVFLCGTAAEISPIVTVDKYPVGTGAIGPVTRELERVFEASLRGTDGSYADWRTPVGFASRVLA